MRIKPVFYGVLVLLVFLGTIQGFKAAGVWSVSGKVSSGGQSVQPVASDVNTIKGWMTLEQVAAAFNLPVEEILAAFGLALDTPPSTAIKDLENETFSVTALRTWLQERGSLPAGETEPAGQPAPVSTPVSGAAVEAPVPTVSATQPVAVERTVTGNTTIQDLLDWGVAESVLKQILGDELPAATTVIKTYVTGKGLEFSSVKAQLQAALDKVE